ncbi:tyrosine-type recombinase/integrase [Amycolatopsis rifamycinica]|uniref:hypothetical protein n=1 Tax=Amycolatopsis rifamycinica TaxID=287986 RepID=UPI000A00352F
MEPDQRRQVWIDPSGGQLLLRSWVDRWFPVQDLDPRTLDNHESYLRCHVLARFGATPLEKITALDVDAWVALVERRRSRRPADWVITCRTGWWRCIRTWRRRWRRGCWLICSVAGRRRRVVCIRWGRGGRQQRKAGRGRARQSNEVE